MINAFSKPVKLLIIIAIVLFTAPPVRADDETRNKAIGLGIGLLATGIEMLSQSSDEQQNSAQSTTTTQTPKAKIQYSKEVADIQSNLKDLGFYNGSADGLKGQQTYQAIEAWRQSVNSEDTGELNFFEIDVLNDRAKTARENKKYKEQNQQSVAKVNDAPLEKAYYSYFSNETLFEVCNEFKNSNHELSYAVDNTLETNYYKVKDRLLQEIGKTKECLNISAEKELIIKERAHQKYKSSQIGQVSDIALKAGPHVFVSEQDAYSRVEGCNVYSRRLKLLYQNVKNKPITCETVQ